MHLTRPALRRHGSAVTLTLAAIMLAGCTATKPEAQNNQAPSNHAQNHRSAAQHATAHHTPGSSRGGRTPAAAPQVPTSAASSSPGPASATLIADLATLPQTPPGATILYRRASFGPAWQSPDGDSCRVRDRVLARSLTHITYRANSTCVVVAGDFTDPYTAAPQHFTKERASQFPIDHVVPLGWIWTHGAWQWTPTVRQRFANDLATPELQLTTLHSNDAKGDAGPAHWMPPNEADRCAYAAAWAQVLSAWRRSTGMVTIDDADRTALLTTLKGCGR